jgi:hypothetical protein
MAGMQDKLKGISSINLDGNVTVYIGKERFDIGKSGSGTKSNPYDLGKAGVGTNQISGADIGKYKSPTDFGPFGASQKLKGLAAEKGVLPGEFFSVTDKDGKVSVFKVNDGGNITRVVNPYAEGGRVRNYSEGSGGGVKGPGTGTSDSIPAMLSNGEYVIKAAAVKQYGVDTFDALNAQRFADGGSVIRRMLNSAISPFGAAGFGIDILSKIDSYRKNKDMGKWIKTSGDGTEWMQKATKNPNSKTIYVYDIANRYSSKDRGPIVDQALEYLTGQTGVQFKRATFGMRNNPDVVKLDWNTLFKDKENIETAGESVPGSRLVTLRSPSFLNLGSLGRRGGKNIIAHEILHSLDIGEYDQDYGKPYNDSSFFGHAKNPFNVMFPFVAGTIPQFVSKSDTESLRYMTDFYNYKSKPIGKAMGGLINLPKFEDGINMVPANMLAMLHKNEAVIPADMNPYNPNANNAAIGGPTPQIYYTQHIHASEGMNVDELVSKASTAAVKVLQTTMKSNAKMVGDSKTVRIDR